MRVRRLVSVGRLREIQVCRPWSDAAHSSDATGHRPPRDGGVRSSAASPARNAASASVTGPRLAGSRRVVFVQVGVAADLEHDRDHPTVGAVAVERDVRTGERLVDQAWPDPLPAVPGGVDQGRWGVEVVGADAERWALLVGMQLVREGPAREGVHVDDHRSAAHPQPVGDQISHPGRVRLEVAFDQQGRLFGRNVAEHPPVGGVCVHRTHPYPVHLLRIVREPFRVDHQPGVRVDVGPRSRGQPVGRSERDQVGTGVGHRRQFGGEPVIVENDAGPDIGRDDGRGVGHVQDDRRRRGARDDHHRPPSERPP